MIEIFPFMSREYDGVFAVQKYAMLDMTLHRAGQHRHSPSRPAAAQSAALRAWVAWAPLRLNNRTLV
jgi:hypothetical protein